MQIKLSNSPGYTIKQDHGKSTSQNNYKRAMVGQGVLSISSCFRLNDLDNKIKPDNFPGIDNLLLKNKQRRRIKQRMAKNGSIVEMGSPNLDDNRLKDIDLFQKVSQTDRIRKSQQFNTNNEQRKRNALIRSSIFGGTLDDEKEVKFDKQILKEFNDNATMRNMIGTSTDCRIKPKVGTFLPRNQSPTMNQILMPYNNWSNLPMTAEERFTTTTSSTMQDRGQKQRVQNLHLERDDIRHTRRFMETYSNKAISHAANNTKAFRTSIDAINRMRNYVKCVDIVDKHGYKQTEERNFTDSQEWVPCRFDQKGWKYQDKGTLQPILNHPNKINYAGISSVGRTGTKLSIQKMKDHLNQDHYLTTKQSQRNRPNETSMTDMKQLLEQMNDSPVAKNRRGNRNSQTLQNSIKTNQTLPNSIFYPENANRLSTTFYN